MYKSVISPTSPVQTPLQHLHLSPQPWSPWTPCSDRTTSAASPPTTSTSSLNTTSSAAGLDNIIDNDNNDNENKAVFWIVIPISDRWTLAQTESSELLQKKQEDLHNTYYNNMVMYINNKNSDTDSSVSGLKVSLPLK